MPHIRPVLADVGEAVVVTTQDTRSATYNTDVHSLKDIVRCPNCGGGDIVYSCEPKCCFNHVCADCRSTFEINTVKTAQSVAAPAGIEEPQSGEPTTCCASCESLRLAVHSSDIDQTLLVCGHCGALSRMVIEEFVAGGF